MQPNVYVVCKNIYDHTRIRKIEMLFVFERGQYSFNPNIVSQRTHPFTRSKMNNESSFEQCVFSARNARRLASDLRKPNHSGKKNEISTAEYWKNAAKQRRKANKTKTEKRDTFRRSEQPDERDDELENVHYANFLGDKHGSVLYNDPLRLTPLRFTPSSEETQAQTETLEQEDEEEMTEEEEQYLYPDAGDYSIPRKERDYYIEYNYYAPTDTLTGERRFRRIGDEKEPTQLLTLEMPEDDNY